MNNKQKALDLINAYLEKQNKTELAAQKVELGNMTAIKGALMILKGFDGKATKVVEKFEAKFKDYFNEYDNVVKVRNDIYNFVEREATGIAKTFEANAKELGVNPNDISEYKELQKWIDEGVELYKAIDRDYKRPKL